MLKFVNALGRGGDDRRGSGRFAIQGVTSDRGKVMDLSATGARLIRRRPWPVERSMMMAVRADRHCVVASARSTRCVRLGLFKYDVGVTFEQMSQESRERLIRMAMTYSRSTAFIRKSA
ncbi:MAG: hypothetical protein KDA21_07390 [Phycisphaerales bacterium]|nr:hypothetical protein [Phycisphaerales bacterium]